MFAPAVTVAFTVACVQTPGEPFGVDRVTVGGVVTLTEKVCDEESGSLEKVSVTFSVIL